MSAVTKRSWATGKRPLVSVITPSYNRASFLETCLSSVMAQDYERVEHIVVDGGSQDGTVELLRSYESRYDLRWVSEPDEGMYHAINKGLSMARGEVVCYLNTDDAYLPWSVAAAVERLSEGPDSVFGDLLVAKQVAGRDVSYVQFYPRFSMQRYTWLQTVGQPTVFWTRDLYERIGGFDTSFSLIADCEYWLRMASRGASPVKFDEVLAVQVDHEETLRETQAERLQAEFRELRSRYSAYSSPPRLPRLRRLISSARWRADNAALVVAHMLDGRGSRWSRFVRFVRRSRIPFLYRYSLFGAIPGLMRADMGLSLLDAEMLLEQIRENGSSR